MGARAESCRQAVAGRGLPRCRAAPHWTEDEQLLNRSLPAEPVPQAAELGAFTHTDSWRVLRIQGEFVHGINASAEIGAAVAVFGSARFHEPHPLYEPRAAREAAGRRRFRRDHRRWPGLDGGREPRRLGGGGSRSAAISNCHSSRSTTPTSTSRSTSVTFLCGRPCSSSIPKGLSSSRWVRYA